MPFNYKEIDTLDYFDSRDVVDRIAHLNERIGNHGDMFTAEEMAHVRLERLVLHTLLEELAEHFPPSKWMDVRTDTSCGVSGFAEHYAQEYAQKLASDITGMDREQSWLFNRIDWEAAVEDLKQDYAEVEILGATFYLRD